MQAKCCCPTNHTYIAASDAHGTMCRAQALLAEVSKSGDGCKNTVISSPVLRMGLLQLWLLLGLLASAASLLECPACHCTYARAGACPVPPCDTQALYCLYSDALGVLQASLLKSAPQKLSHHKTQFDIESIRSHHVYVLCGTIFRMCVFKMYLLYRQAFACVCSKHNN